MKNLKKVLAMVLAFACTFSMFAGAKVFEDVPAGSDYSEAITMLSDLGVIQGKDDGKYHPEDTITRAEACAMIARLMTGDPNVSQYVGAQSFTDVAKGSWKDSAIGYCYINGIVIGVGNNKFEPDRAITDAEFVTMVVRAMGYETADMKQNYPFSYMSNAQAIGLLDGTNMVASTDALRGEDAQVIYNALFADYARGAKLVNTTHGTSVESYPTLAESVWGLTRAAAGTWKNNKDGDKTATLEYCKAHTWVVLGNDPAAEGHILAYPISDNDGDLYAMGKNDVEAVSFKYDGDASAVAGYQVELWGEGSHGEPEWNNKEDKYVYSEDWTIKAIKTVKGQKAYDYNASMADSKSTNGTIELGEASLDLDAVAANAKKYEQQYAVDQYVADEYNGVTIKDAEDVEEALNIRDGAQYKLMDWDSDGDIDWVVVSTANYYKVESVTSKRLTLSYMDTKNKDEEKQTDSKTLTWKLDDMNDEGDYKLDVKGAEDLEEGDVIEVTYSVAYDKGEKAQVVTANVAKVEADTLSLDKVSTKDNLVLTFDGETMELAQNKEVGDTIVPANPSMYAGFDEEELGTEFNIWTDRNGFIVYSDYATESTNYMMVLDTADGSDKTGDRKQAVIDFVSADNKLHKDVKLTASARILKDDGRTETDAYDDGDRTFDESKIVGNVYKYWTNEDGEITKMQEVVTDAQSSAYEYVSKNDRLTIVEDGKTNSYALEDAKVIFAVIEDYIKNESDSKEGAVDLYVNSGDVLAVKQSDIPDIGGLNGTAQADEDKQADTKAEALDKDSTTAATKSWVNSVDAKVALSANSNKDVSAAVLGVDSFNKFNAGATKVGLVTNVSYDSNDVVSIDVAYNGKVETISSAEKVDFDDIVSVMDYTAKNNTKEYSVGSRTEDIKNGIMKGTDLKTYLNKSAAYAEITVNADGKLTDVMFMDQKADANTVIGNYYQVSRKVITDIEDGKWISTYNDDVTYASEDNLYTIDTKNKQTIAQDFADEVFYYTIEGQPTRADGSYTGKALSVLDEIHVDPQNTNFKGNPDINVAEAGDMEVSDIRNDAAVANDSYVVADIASKIDDEDKGDVTAVYMFEGDMDETIALTDASSIATIGDIMVGDKVDITVDAADDANLDKNKMYIDVLDANGDKVLSDIKVTDGKNSDIDTSKLAAGTYTVVLYGYNTANKDYEKLATQSMEVLATTVAVSKVADLKASAAAGTLTVNPVDAKGNPVVGLTPSDFTVYLGTQKLDITAALGTSNGEWKITSTSVADWTTLGNDVTVKVGTKVSKTYEELANAAASMDVTDNTYKLGSATGSTVEFDVVLKNVDASDVALKAPVEGVSYNAKTGKVNISAAELNKLAKDGTIKFTLAYSGAETISDKEITITAQKMDAANVTKSEFKDLGSNQGTLTLTLDSSLKGMDAVITEVETHSSWTINNTGAFATTAPTVSAVEVSADGTQIVLSLNTTGATPAAAALSFSAKPDTSFNLGTVADMTIAK